MPLAVEAEFLKRNPKKQLCVGVAIDGSALSDKALQAACSLVQQARGDRLVILHVADSSKKYLPRHLQPKHLENTYTSKAFDFRVSRVSGQLTCSCVQLQHHGCNSNTCAVYSKHGCAPCSLHRSCMISKLLFKLPRNTLEASDSQK